MIARAKRILDITGFAGRVVGTNGSRLHKVEEQTGAHIRIHDHDGTNEVSAIITGTVRSVEAAAEFISRLEQVQKSISIDGIAGLIVKHRDFYARHSGCFVRIFREPDRAVIKGKAADVRILQALFEETRHRFGCMAVYNKCRRETTIASVASAISDWEFSAECGVRARDDDRQSNPLEVIADFAHQDNVRSPCSIGGCVGHIIGPKGRNLKRIQERTNCLVRVDDQKEVATVQGLPQDVSNAIWHIQKQLHYYRRLHSNEREKAAISVR